MKQGAFIFGIGRSGTTFVTDLSMQAGYHAGLVQDTNENVHITRENDRLLRMNGGSWDNPPYDLKKGRIERSYLKNFLDPNEPKWVIKDPRMTWLYPIYKRILPHFKIIICLRDPHNVALSIYLQSRFEVSYHHARNLWTDYNLQIIKMFEDRVIECPPLVLYYPDMEDIDLLNNLDSDFIKVDKHISERLVRHKHSDSPTSIKELKIIRRMIGWNDAWRKR